MPATISNQDRESTYYASCFSAMFHGADWRVYRLRGDEQEEIIRFTAVTQDDNEPEIKAKAVAMILNGKMR